MCSTEYFTEVRPTGETKSWSRTKLCRKSRNGHVCEDEQEFRHPVAYITPTAPGTAPAARLGTSPPVLTYAARPPTPRHTPNSSTSSIPLVYHSGNESESRSPKRSSGVYVNGTKVIDLTKRRDHSNRSAERRDRGTERIIVVEHPPTPRTPPTPYAVPYTAPPSPIAGGNCVNVVDATRPRPLIVDERTVRPRVDVETVTVSPPHRVVSLDVPKRHRRSNSHGSNTSSNAVSGDELRRQQRREERERADREAAERELREQRIRREIRRQNEAIAARSVPGVPVLPPTPPPHPNIRRMSTNHNAASLHDAMRQLDLGEQLARDEEEALARERLRAQARAELLARQEERERERRLRERMTPRRRATVGPGGRRHRILYDDGIWRWE